MAVPGATCETRSMASAKRVLVTRAAHQGSALADELKKLGLEPVLIPTLEIAPPSSYASVDVALHALERFDWLVCTSANAVEVFAERRPSEPVPGHLKVAAIGQATARALATAGLDVHLLPAQAVAESLAEALLPFVQRPDGKPARFLLLRAEQGRDALPDLLRAAGAEVTVAPAYRTVIPASSAADLREWLAGDGVGLGAVTFTSSSSARNLIALCDAAGISLPERLLRVSIGPVTSATLRDLGFPPHAEALEASVASLAEAVGAVLEGSS